jgi:hypothetical protein
MPGNIENGIRWLRKRRRNPWGHAINYLDRGEHYDPDLTRQPHTCQDQMKFEALRPAPVSIQV